MDFNVISVLWVTLDSQNEAAELVSLALQLDTFVIQRLENVFAHHSPKDHFAQFASRTLGVLYPKRVVSRVFVTWMAPWICNAIRSPVFVLVERATKEISATDVTLAISHFQSVNNVGATSMVLILPSVVMTDFVSAMTMVNALAR